MGGPVVLNIFNSVDPFIILNIFRAPHLIFGPGNVETGPINIPTVTLVSVKLSAESSWALFAATLRPFTAFLKRLVLSFYTLLWVWRKPGEGWEGRGLWTPVWEPRCCPSHRISIVCNCGGTGLPWWLYHFTFLVSGGNLFEKGHV